MKRFARRALIAAIMLSISIVPCVSRSQILAGLAIEKLGLLWNPGTGARPFAMGGAYTAVSDDAFALIYNPAGLAEIRRREISIGLHQRGDEITNTYLDLSATHSSSSTSLGHIAAVYPYPTYRGSLVLAFGVFQAGNSHIESVKNGYLADISATVENNYVQSGTIYQYHFGAGFDLSPKVAIGGSLVIWDASINFIDEITYADDDSAAFWEDNVSMDLDGVSFNAGLLLRPTEYLRAGLSISSPAWLSFNGEGVTNYSGTYDAGGGWTTDPYYASIDEEYTLPMKFRGGLAMRLPSLTIAGDIAYSDYSQTKYNGLAIMSELEAGKKHILERTVNLHLGAEVTLPMAPIRLRGGFAYVPFEISTLEEIAYIVDDSPNRSSPSSRRSETGNSSPSESADSSTACSPSISRSRSAATNA